MAKKKKRRSTADRARERAKNQNSNGGGSYLKNVDHEFTPKKGTNMIDIVPYEITVDNNPDAESGELDSTRTIYVHYGIGAEETRYICPKTIGKKCPVCEVMKELYKEGDKDGGNAIRPKERELRNVWNHEEDRAEVWEHSQWTFGKLLNEEINEDEDEVYAGFSDLEDGFTIKARMKEEKFNGNTYLEAGKIDFKKRADFPESILDEVYDLDEILIVPSYEELQKAFLEVDEDEEEETNGRSSKKDSKSSKTSRRRRSDADDDDADDDDDIDDDDDDIDDDEDWDDDIDDDDDDIDDDDDDSDAEEEDELDDESDDDESDDDESEGDESEDDDEVDDDEPAPRRRTRTKSTPKKRNTKSASSSRGGGTKSKSKKSVKKKAPEKKPTRRRRTR